MTTTAPPKEDTKRKLLEIGAGIMHRKGFHHTGIQEVLDAAGVPKGSFYFYFPSKEAFGLAIIDFYEESFAQMVGPILARPGLSARGKVKEFFDFFTQFFTDIDFTCGCPIGNLTQELGDQSPVFRERLQRSVEGMTAMFAAILAQGREAGELRNDIPALDEAAGIMVTGWYGSLVRMKALKSPEPLLSLKRFLLATLFLPESGAESGIDSGTNSNQ